MKATIITLIILSGFTAVNAQQITFDKKSGDFSSPTGVVAKLNSEKVKEGKFNLGMGVGKNFFVTDATGATEYLGYLLHRFNDTLGGPTVWYYTMRSTPLGLNASCPDLDGSFKAVGQLVVSKNLVQTDGKMNETAMREYFKAQQNQFGDYPAMLAARNDSMVQLITVTSTPPQRNMNKGIDINEFGKIGQDNTVIGYWELVVTPPSNGIGSNEYHYVIRNLNNGIVCMVWMTIGGSNMMIFDNGKRTEDRIPPSMQMNPVNDKVPFLSQVASKLVGKGLL